MLQQARKLLKTEYEKCLQTVKGDDYYTGFANEKWIHSWQVFGSGNYIIKHEPWFAMQNADLIEKARTAVLLHDVSRFEEIARKFLRQEKIDHGERGYQKLKEMPEYDECLVAFAIKHHGHPKERFYEDSEFTAIGDKGLRDKVEHIFWLIRDADKIANFNMVCYQREKYMSLFIPKPDELKSNKRIISPEVVKEFYQCKTVDYGLRQTLADYQTAFVSWFFDLYYKTSVTFCRKLHLINIMFAMLAECHQDQQLNRDMQEALETYFDNHFA